jgi:peptidoglycan/LPS O-acetylase OafA/YrhL
VSSQLAFRPDLQGLRAVAVSLVVLAHANVGWFEGGFVGVDVFFVLSGYLITTLLVREHDRQGRIGFLDFYARRVKRLFPALLLMIVVVAIMGVWLLTDFEANQQLASSPFAAVWASNFYFALAGLDYFNDLTKRDLFLHTWSLGVEEQFYLIWPLILLFVLSCFGRKTRFGFLVPILLLSSIALGRL